MFQGIGALMVSRVGASSGCGDTDANAFISATGITDATIKAAICTLVTSAKANGWWTKCYAIYPFPDGTQSHCQVNLKNPGTYDLTFHGSWTFASTGALPDGSSAYADTGINVSTIFTLNDTHCSYYSRTDTASSGTKKEWGAYISGSGDNGIQFLAKVNIGSDVALSDMYNLSGGPARVTGANSTTNAYFMVSRTSSPSHVIYKNGSSIGSNAFTQGSLVNLTMFIAALNQNGSAVNFTDRECAFSTFGTGIDSTLAATMYTDIQTFQTSLSRQV